MPTPEQLHLTPIKTMIKRMIIVLYAPSFSPSSAITRSKPTTESLKILPEHFTINTV